MINVLLIDSGSGGVNILKECLAQCPFCNFLLFCDDKNLPYGSKSKAELQKIAIENLRRIEKFFKFEIVVIACNTLTCTCLEKLRKSFPRTIFIGTVPALKPALERFLPSEILVLATPVTIKHNVLINKNPQVRALAIEDLASQIDAHLDELEVLQEPLSKIFDEFLAEQSRDEKSQGAIENLQIARVTKSQMKPKAKKCQKMQTNSKLEMKNGKRKRISEKTQIGQKSKIGQKEAQINQKKVQTSKETEQACGLQNCSRNVWRPKAVVLGCTHYVAVEGILRQILGGDTMFFNSANGVARRLRSIVEEQSEKPLQEGYQVQIMVSGDQENLAKFCWWYQK